MTDLRYFSPEELRCRGCVPGRCLRDPYGFQLEAALKLDKLRELMDQPLIINSAYRCPFHNAAVGGAASSRHKVGDAFDISLRNVENKSRLISCAKLAGFTGFGFYGTFLHVDTGPVRVWVTKAGRKTWTGLI